MARRAAVKSNAPGRREADEAIANRTSSGCRRLFWRTSLCLLLVAAAASMWLGVELVQARRQHAAVEAIRGLGGIAQHEFSPWASDVIRPPWHRAWLGHDDWNSVSVVRLSGTEACDEDLIAVGHLTQLRMLDLRDTRITDQGLRHLSGLRDLEVLVLTGTAVSDQGLEHLADMPGLKVLCLDETKVTSGGLPLLQRFPRLGWLNLSNTAITTEGLTHLRAYPALEVLVVDPCPLSQEDIKAFQESTPGIQVYDGTRRRPPFHYFSHKHFP